MSALTSLLGARVGGIPQQAMGPTPASWYRDPRDATTEADILRQQDEANAARMSAARQGLPTQPAAPGAGPASGGIAAPFDRVSGALEAALRGGGS